MLFAGNEMRVQQIRSKWNSAEVRRALRDGSQHHTREGVHGAVVLVSYSTHTIVSR